MMKTDVDAGARRKTKRKRKSTDPPPCPNMQLPCFKAATSVRLRLTRRFTTFMPDDELQQSEEAAQLGEQIGKFLGNVPRRHRRHWQKFLRLAYPELKANSLQDAMVKLVIRCWHLRSSARPFALHDFIEFCAGQGNLSVQCLKSFLHGLALDKIYHSDHDMMTRVGLRCWIDAAGETRPGAMVWFGTRCSSFVGMCRYHHNRVEANGYWGNEKHQFVRDGNMQMVTYSAILSLPARLS